MTISSQSPPRIPPEPDPHESDWSMKPRRGRQKKDKNAHLTISPRTRKWRHSRTDGIFTNIRTVGTSCQMIARCYIWPECERRYHESFTEECSLRFVHYSSTVICPKKVSASNLLKTFAVNCRARWMGFLCSSNSFLYEHWPTEKSIFYFDLRCVQCHVQSTWHEMHRRSRNEDELFFLWGPNEHHHSILPMKEWSAGRAAILSTSC